ncbi:hypothetical protein N7494_007720 [Penicillium frequentans]|uniref:Dickkopf N-terminal cysteine-rich domain-containing protein n=1 Tax=Penicillium frequentans TaxID=3151616 RepID=A0AAD6GF10_9EURO|nr:hypothetical protein N7494_007720 [Penicillium glabrum]
MQLPIISHVHTPRHEDFLPYSIIDEQEIRSNCSVESLQHPSDSNMIDEEGKGTLSRLQCCFIAAYTLIMAFVAGALIYGICTYTNAATLIHSANVANVTNVRRDEISVATILPLPLADVSTGEISPDADAPLDVELASNLETSDADLDNPATNLKPSGKGSCEYDSQCNWGQVCHRRRCAVGCRSHKDCLPRYNCQRVNKGGRRKFCLIQDGVTCQEYLGPCLTDDDCCSGSCQQWRGGKICGLLPG